jgi:hypothetical protein
MSRLDDRELAVLRSMAEYPLEPGQMLLLGPLSCAYLRGDWRRAPWLIKGEKAPGGKLLPDKVILDRQEWACFT